MSKRELKKLNKKLDTEEFKDALIEVDLRKMTFSERSAWKEERAHLLSMGYIVREKNGNRITTHFSPNEKLTEKAPKSTARKIADSVAKAPLNFAVRSVKSVGQKINPLNKEINKNDTADTGVESLRLTHKSIKTTKNAVKTTKDVTTATVKVAKTTVKAAQYTFKFVYEVAAQAVAIVINPIFLVIAAIVIMVVMVFGVFMILIGGQSNSEEGMTTGEGLVDVTDQYKKAKEFYNNALSKRKQNFTGIIDNIYYNSDDLEHSHLVYVERVNDHNIFPKYYANGDNKNKIKNMWDYKIDEKEMIAIAYVWLELKENTEKNTYLQIYEVEYDQDLFIDLLQKSVPLSYIITDGQECPTADCQRSSELYNRLQDAARKESASANAFNEWFAHEYWHNTTWSIDDWWNVYGWLYDTRPYYDNAGQDYGQYLGNKYAEYVSATVQAQYEYDNTKVCEHHHRLHNIGISFFSKDELMDLLGFDETYKNWVELTIEGFNNNPDIT